MTPETDSYHTIQKPAIHEIKIKGSRFIGYSEKTATVKSADFFIRTISKKHFDATHNCWAYRLKSDSQAVFRYQDDGEPQGTAGKPILDAIDGLKLTNVICVVSRYFGGTKLGTGGLARAYKQCAVETLRLSGKTTKYNLVTFHITFDYALTGTVMNLISNLACTIINTEYGEKTGIVLQIRSSMASRFQQEMMNITAGKATVSEKEASHP